MLIGYQIKGTIGAMAGIPALWRDWALCYADMVEFNRANWLQPNEQVKRVWAGVSTHEIARNGIAEEREGEWTWFTDCDTTFPPDTLMRLVRTLDEGGVDVVCAPYPFGAKPHAPVIYAWNDEIDDFQLVAKWRDEDSYQPFLVAGAGGGCLLVRNSVFDRLEVEFPGMGPFAIEGKYRTDDLPFFFKCHKLGIKVACDPRIEVGHLRPRAVKVSDLEPGDLEMELVAPRGEPDGSP